MYLTMPNIGLHINLYNAKHRQSIVGFIFCSCILQQLSKEDQNVQAELGKFWNDTVSLVYCFLSTTMF